MTVNVDAFDVFTLGHAAYGAVARVVGAPLWLVVTVALAWELAEDTLKDGFPGVFPNASHDTKKNALGDVAGALMGYGGMSLGLWFAGSRGGSRLR